MIKIDNFKLGTIVKYRKRKYIIVGLSNKKIFTVAYHDSHYQPEHRTTKIFYEYKINELEIIQ